MHEIFSYIWNLVPKKGAFKYLNLWGTQTTLWQDGKNMHYIFYIYWISSLFKMLESLQMVTSFIFLGNYKDPCRNQYGSSQCWSVLTPPWQLSTLPSNILSLYNHLCKSSLPYSSKIGFIISSLCIHYNHFFILNKITNKLWVFHESVFYPK